MIDEHTKVKKELENNKSIIDNFTYNFERLDMLLKNQWAIFNHVSLGYKRSNK